MTTPTPSIGLSISPGMAIFQVWKMSKLIGGNVEVLGPYTDAGTASQVAALHPGAMLAVTTFLFQTPANPVPANKPTLTPVPK